MARTSNDIKIDLMEIMDNAPDEDQKKKVEEDILGELYAAQTMRRGYVGKSASAARIKALVQEAIEMRDEGGDEEAVDYLVDMFMDLSDKTPAEKRGGRKKSKKTRKSKKTKKTKKTRATRRR